MCIKFSSLRAILFENIASSVFKGIAKNIRDGSQIKKGPKALKRNAGTSQNKLDAAYITRSHISRPYESVAVSYSWVFSLNPDSGPTRERDPTASLQVNSLPFLLQCVRRFVSSRHKQSQSYLYILLSSSAFAERAEY